MGPKVSFTNTSIGRIGRLADVPKDSSAEVSFNGGYIEEMKEGLVERDTPSLEVLSNLLKELGIEQDAEKREAFKELVLLVKEKGAEGKIKEEVKKSKLFTLLGSSERIVNTISSAVTIATTIGALI